MINQIKINTLLFSSMFICTSIFAGTTYIGGVSNINSAGNGSICSPNTGANTAIPTFYTCSVALGDGGYAVLSVNKNTDGYPDYSDLATKLQNIKSNSIVIGADTETHLSGDVALGNNSKTRAVSSSTPVTLAGTTYNYAGSNPTNAVSVGNSNNERVIQNVAAGQISATSTDAVNGSQLYAAYNAIESIYQRQMAGYDSEIKQINQDIDQLKEGAYAGIAGAMAIGNLPQPSTPGKNMISGGMGTYKGHSAAAFGFSSVTENDKVIWKIGASFDSNRNSGGAASIGYQW